MSVEQAGLPALSDVGGWRYEYTLALPVFGRISFWRHTTGSRHMHGWEVTGKPAFGLTFRTESANDRGAAHVLEHLVGAGSRRYPCNSAIFTSMFRTMTDFANGFTEIGRTSYTFVAAEVTDYALMLDVLLDGVYQPILGEREFIREGARHRLPSADNPSGYISGAVYNEMQLKLEREDEWVSRLLARRSEPTGFAQYRHEGTPEGVSALEYEECLNYYQRWYRPAYSISFSTGAGLSHALRKLDSAHSEREAGLPPDSVSDGCCGDEPLSGPRRLLGKSWGVAEARFADNTVGDWARGLTLVRNWRQAIGHAGLDVVSVPALMDGRLTVWCAVRGGGEKTDIARKLAEMTATAPAPQHAEKQSAEMVAAHLGERYRGMPNELRWSLALAPLCVTGIDQASFWSFDDQADWHEEAPALKVTDVSGDDYCAAAGAWSPERAVSDNRIWLGAGVSADARVLPIRRLRDRDSRPLEHARPLADGGAYLHRPGPVRTYRHLVLGVDPEILCLLPPVTDAMRRRMGAAGEDVLGPCAIRSDNGGQPLVDMVLPVAASSLEPWSSILKDREVMSEIIAEAASRLKQLRARVITRPAEMASRMCAATACATGRANELLTGYSAARRLQSLLEEKLLLTACVKRAAERLDGALALPVIVGEDLARAEIQERAPSDRNAGPAHDAAGIGPEAPQIPALLASSGVGCATWDARPVAEHDWPALLVVTAHLQRYLHQRVREDGGAYGVTAQPDIPARTVVAWSQGDPIPGRTLEIYRSMWTEALDRASEDDVETAKLMAVQSERTRRTTVTYLVGLGHAAPSLNGGFADAVGLVGIDSMRRVGTDMATREFHAVSLPRLGTPTIV
jgi:hypothetical protein